MRTLGSVGGNGHLPTLVPLHLYKTVALDPETPQTIPFHVEQHCSLHQRTLSLLPTFSRFLKSFSAQIGHAFLAQTLFAEKI